MSDTKTCVQYVTVATLLFTFCGGSEFKCLVSNTLNMADSVHKRKSDIKTNCLMQP